MQYVIHIWNVTWLFIYFFLSENHLGVHSPSLSEVEWKGTGHTSYGPLHHKDWTRKIRRSTIPTGKHDSSRTTNLHLCVGGAWVSHTLVNATIYTLITHSHFPSPPTWTFPAGLYTMNCFEPSTRGNTQYTSLVADIMDPPLYQTYRIYVRDT